MATMDLWYDLAIRERPARDASAFGPFEPEEQEAKETKPAADAETRKPLAVDFF